jgi:type IX secretion system PorP/SprF family membrane protein
MKKALLVFVAILSFLLSSQKVFAQDPQFTQFYANPLYLNPALAGSKLCPRFCANYRNQWPGISGTYATTGASFDKMVYELHGGIGLLATTDEAGQGTIRTTTISGIYSYHQQISRTFTIAAAMEATFTQKSLDWSKVNFGDMIDPARGFVYQTGETPGPGSRSNLDISTGIVGYSDYYFIGFSAHHLTQPNESLLTSGTSTLPVKYTVHGGANIPVGDFRNPDIIVSPNMIWQQQQNFQELNLGLYVKKEAIVGGLWYRNRDSFILLVGIDKGNIRIGYSYDLTISRLTNTTAGAHEVSFAMGFKCKHSRPHYRPDFCPAF